MPEIEAPGPLSSHFHIPVGFTMPQDAEVDALVLKAENLTISLAALGDRVEAKIAERAAAFRAELDSQTAGVSDRAEKGDIDAVMRVADLKVADEATRFRGGVIALEQGNINEQLSQINAVKERLDAVLRIFPSPSALLSASALGNPQRDSYLQQVAGAGHAELENRLTPAVVAPWA